MNNQRKNYVDIVRGIAIILVVFGHAGYPEYLGRFASFFHVPVFFFLSGLFYSDVYSLRPHLLDSQKASVLVFAVCRLSGFILDVP
jgi:fucose 4-O-acetylase-like acetyltransferase